MRNYIFVLLALATAACSNDNNSTKTMAASDTTGKGGAAQGGSTATANGNRPPLDTAKYHELNAYLANGDTTGRWPVKGPLPLGGAILPFKRVVAYYGNRFSVKMGALGKWPKKEMIPKLLEETRKWTEADPKIPAVPCLHYICVTAQGAPGKDSMWRYRMPLKEIDTMLNWAKEINAIVFIDVQVGLSDLETEIPLLEKALVNPNVHLGIDPEFAMRRKGNKRPGSVIGTMDASEINWVSEYLAKLVQQHNLPPKMFMVHRFTQGMVTNYQNIKLRPEVQIIMDMDGWGPPAKKKDTYYSWIAPQPVQFTGFKLFYVNDTEKSGMKEMMSRSEVLGLRPKPIYIQYQ